jgi:hypothetical protein
MGLDTKTGFDFDFDLNPVSLKTTVSECSSSAVRAWIAFLEDYDRATPSREVR